MNVQADHTRDTGWRADVDGIWRDLRDALRTLSRSRGFLFVAVFTLALGIGANTAIFSLVNGLLLRPLPVPSPDRLVTISSETAVRFGFTAGAGWNYQMWDRLRQRTGAFAGACAFTPGRFNLAPAGERQPAEGLYVSGDFFGTVGVPAMLGRTFTADDDVRGGGSSGPVAVVSYRFWQRHLGGAPTIVGTTIHIDGVAFTIVGVTPPEFRHVEVGRTFDVAVPLATQPLIRGRREAAIDQPRAFLLIVMLRLKPEQSLDAATATLRGMQPDILGVRREELTQVRPALLAEPYMLVPASGGTSGAAGAGLRQQFERPLVAMLIVAAIVLSIACANLASLLLARATDRRHEWGVRRALGASRWRLVRQSLVESLVLAVLGAGGGTIIAAWGSRLLVSRLSTPQSQVALDLSMDWTVLAYTMGVTAATLLFFGTVPALYAAGIPPGEALRAAGPPTRAGLRGLPVARIPSAGFGSLVIIQVAFSLVLMAAAGLFIRTFVQLAHVPLGFNPDRMLVVNVDTARVSIDTDSRHAYDGRLIDAARRVPGVIGAAASIWTPLSGGGTLQDAQGRAIDAKRAVTNAVTPGWFDVYDTAFRSGRDFDDHDDANALPVAIVNEAFVRTFLPGRSAIGETVEAGPIRRTVIGVVADTAFARSVRDAPPPMMYVPMSQSAGLTVADTAIRISVRSHREPSSVTRELAAALAAVSSDVVFDFQQYSDTVDGTRARERLTALISGFFGLTALFLAVVGLYGMTACTVAQRRMEIAIRMALGARRSGVIALMVRGTLGLTAVGLVLGLATAAGLARFASALLFGVRPVDPLTFAGAAVTFAAVAAAAACMATWRAASVDPAVALRRSQ